MSEKIMIENKRIQVGDNQYRLSIEKTKLPFTVDLGYVVYLSDVNSQFSTEGKFFSAKQINDNLNEWLIQADLLNDPETRIFQQLEEWDGVVRI